MNLRDIVDSQHQDEGVGDTVKRVAVAVGVKKPCTPCQKRREALNRTFPYRKGISKEMIEAFHAEQAQLAKQKEEQKQ